MLGLIAAKVGMKAAGAAGSALYGAANAVAKTGQAFGMAGKALAGSTDGDSKQDTQPSNIVVGNFGMAGTAGRQRITGGGTLPAPKTAAKPQVSAKMPTKALLDTVIKYLTSIDKTLKSQIDFDRRAMQEQTQVEREAIIESRPSVTFSDIKDRLSGLKSDVKDNVSTAATIAKFALVLGGAAALIANAMDQKELDALRQNVDQFKKTFGWLGELGSMIPAGGILGFLFGGKGLKGRLIGGLVGILAEAVATSIFNKATGQDATGEGGTGDNTAINIAATGAMGYLGYRGVKAGIGLSKSVSAIGAAKAGIQASGSFAARRAAVRTVAADSAKTGLTFLKGPMWKRFLAFLIARGKKELVRKIQQRIAISLATGAVAATGVGAVFGAIGFLLNLGFSLFLMYEIYQLWQQFTASDTADKAGVGDAEIAKELNGADATKVAGTSASYSTTTATGGQNKTITGVVDGGPGYTTVTYADGTTERRGGTLPARTNNPGNIMYGDIAKSYGAVGSSPSTNGPPVAVFPTPTHGFAAMDGLLTSKYSNGPIGQTIEAWATDPTHPAKVLGSSGLDPNKKYTDFSKEEKVKFMQSLAKVEGYYAAGSGPTVSSADSMGASSGIAGMVNAGAGKLGEVFGMLGSSIIKPGVKRQDTPSASNVSENMIIPSTSTTNTSERINNESTKLQNDITFGIKKEKSKDSITKPAVSAGKLSTPSPVKSVSSMDPNYGNMDVLTKYLAHFRLAA